FVLWELAVRTLLDHIPREAGGSEYHVLFAGGVHDGLSGAMVAAMAAPLADRGVRIGALVGTAYLFTEEAVRCGAITSDFQRAAVSCDATTLLESGPGHTTRCVPSPYTADFDQQKRQLLSDGVAPAALRDHLEMLNVGR